MLFYLLLSLASVDSADGLCFFSCVHHGFNAVDEMLLTLTLFFSNRMNVKVDLEHFPQYQQLGGIVPSEVVTRFFGKVYDPICELADFFSHEEVDKVSSECT